MTHNLIADFNTDEAQLQARLIPFHEVGDFEIACWHDLASRTCHWNPFQLPEFVLPATRHLEPNEPGALAVVEDPKTRSWLAAGAFHLMQSTWSLPLAHVSGMRSRHTYRTGPLVDARRAGEALDTLLGLFAKTSGSRHGIEFSLLRLDSILARELRSSAQRLGFGWHVSDSTECPAVFPEILSEEYLNRHWTPSSRKSFRRSHRRLEKLGPVSFVVHRDPGDIAIALDMFLRLEKKSWKGLAGSACASTIADERFVREMVATMSLRGNLAISELRVGDRVAASSLNLILGGTLCAFKIGWDQDLADCSPGVLHEIELLKASEKELTGFTLLDGCTSGNSYLASIWPERLPIGNVIITSSTWGKAGRMILEASRRMMARR
jgi:CelD/BcsL family acetyltransferase involved in cellulose biosynthesis